jgi:hypothetical protein
MFARQLGMALRSAWLVVSLELAVVLLAPFLLSAETIYALAPVCEWKARRHKECVLCGMTRSFVAISRGDFSEAMRRNRGSIPLYALMIVNEGAALGFALGWLQSKRRNLRANSEPGVGRACVSGDAGRFSAVPGSA